MRSQSTIVWRVSTRDVLVTLVVIEGEAVKEQHMNRIDRHSRCHNAFPEFELQARAIGATLPPPSGRSADQ